MTRRCEITHWDDINCAPMKMKGRPMRTAVRYFMFLDRQIAKGIEKMDNEFTQMLIDKMFGRSK